MASIDFGDLIERLTDNAKESLRQAETIARGSGSPYIGTEHILLGVLAQESSIASKVLEDSGVTLDRAKVALNLTPKNLSSPSSYKGLSETAKLTLKMSWDIAQEFDQEHCGTEHILYSILNQKNARATILLKDMNIEVGSVVSELEGYLNKQQYTKKTKVKNKIRRKTAIDYFGVDLTFRARQNKLDPVIGRQPQIQRMVTVLNRRTKNNPVLIGEPGVGKTAIVEGLAQRIVSEEVPDSLLDKRIVMLDLAGMVAGTKYRGEFEDRLKRVIEDLVKSDEVIVFIDEMHLLVGAGAAEGAIDAGNMLKPALARGDIQVIGATTLDEYSKYVEKDAALERRFQPITIPETTLEETTAILRGLRQHYEDFHGVEIADDILVKTVRLDNRYINDRFLPDKAIDLIDEAAAHVRVSRQKASPEQRKVLKELRQLSDLMEEAANEGNYQRAAKYKVRINQLEKQLEKLKGKSKTKTKLTEDDLAEVIAIMTGIPTAKIAKTEAKYLMDLEKHLSKSIIGQKEALEAVAKAIRRNRSGVSDGNRPIGSFVFLGPSGVGKTETARVLAREFYNNPNALIKMDMSEFSEKHTVSRLVGAPAGYVGYEEGGQLTDRVRRQPYSLVLFDEIEKAHPEVFNILLQILEDGHLTDAKGRKVDFSNTIIIMTSNAGADKLQKEASIGFRARSKQDKKKLQQVHQETAEKVIEDMKNYMRPELVNRIDKMVVFKALTNKEAKAILNLQIDQLAERLQSQHIGIKISEAAKNVLLKEGYEAQTGVRPLRRQIQDKIEDYIANAMLKGEFAKGDVIKVGAKGGKLSFAVVNE